MFKLLLVAIVTYIAYSFYQRYNVSKKVDKSTKKENLENNYSKMDIRDAEYKDIEESNK